MSCLDDPANIREHLRILQSIITRMAENSRYCKAWCIALVSAVLIFVARSGPHACYMWIATVPIMGFLILDTYYLALEFRFRGSYERFIGSLHDGTLVAEDVYVVRPAGRPAGAFVRCLGSWAIWPFYGMLFVLLAILSRILN